MDEIFELRQLIEQGRYPEALNLIGEMASLKTANGKYDEEELAQIVNKKELLNKAFELILTEQQKK